MAYGRTELGRIGIEKIRVYPAMLKLNLKELAEHRGADASYVHDELMVHERGVNPCWEDAVTMAVNAAKPMLTAEDIASIGLLIVGSETGLDLEKSLSSWVFHHLGIPSSCRHFEVKSACYGGTAGMRMALSWLQSDQAKSGQKALVISSDQSLQALKTAHEYVGGAGAVAMLLSNQPDFLEVEPGNFGIYSHEVTDVIRPLPWMEIGNGEHSLYSYMEALLGAYDDYAKNVSLSDFESHFDYNVYHVPFSGISYRAHKQLLRADKNVPEAEVLESFNRKTKASIQYPQKIGTTYGASTFIALLSLLSNAPNIKAGDRIGIYAYGTGSCAEYYSAVVGEKSVEVANAAGLDALLKRRKKLTVGEYESFERDRKTMSLDSDFIPDFYQADKVYETHYLNQDLLVYKGSSNFHRTYEFT